MAQPLTMQRAQDFIVGTGVRSGLRAEMAPSAPETGVDMERRTLQLSLVQEWRRVLDRAGYRTMLSVSPPIVLLVRAPGIEHRWLSISTNGLLIVFEKNELGGIRSEYHLLPKGAEDSVGPAATAALHAATQYLAAD
jgi:hypothetical protein